MGTKKFCYFFIDRIFYDRRWSPDSKDRREFKEKFYFAYFVI